MTEITGARLRQDFQNRIDGVRAKSVAVVSDAVRATKDASAALANGDMAAAERLTEMEAADPTAQVGEVEVEVLTLVALEQPVARDLRVLLTARDVAQLGELCLGLCFTLARRASRVQHVLSDDVRAMILELGERVASLLSQANAAWSAIEPDEAEAVIASAGESRLVLRRLFAHLVGLIDFPSQRPSILERWCGCTSGLPTTPWISPAGFYSPLTGLLPAMPSERRRTRWSA